MRKWNELPGHVANKTIEGINNLPHVPGKFLEMLVLGTLYGLSPPGFGMVCSALDITTSPEAKSFDEHKKYSRLDTKFKYSPDAFKKYMESRGKKSHPENTTLNKAQEKYELAVNNLSSLIKDGGYKFGEIIDAMKDVTDEAIRAIEEQHSTELNNKKLNPADITKLKAEQEEQLKAFKEATTAAQTNLHKAAKEEVEYINFLAFISEQSDEMKRKIDAQMPKNEEQAPLIIATNAEKIIHATVDIAKLGDLVTRTGKIITQKDGEFTLQMNSSLYNPYYYMFKNNIKNDMIYLALCIKATGAESITMKVNFNNPTVAMERARAAYLGCIEAGFDADKITIEVNGVIKSAKELYEKEGAPPKKTPITESILAEELKSGNKENVTTLKEQLTKSKNDATKNKIDATQNKNDAAKNGIEEKSRKEEQNKITRRNSI